MGFKSASGGEGEARPATPLAPQRPTLPHPQPGRAIPAGAPKRAPRSQRRAWLAPGPVSEQPWVPTPHPCPCHPIPGPPLQRVTQTTEACSPAQTGAGPGPAGAVAILEPVAGLAGAKN
ncbi:hypothetical protein E2C01_063537 [Portunus trituberculatus]|uniref:Uncharacterized protein n=1 Tax=Portunus trituberculatus TaxID=210409 RepID=A0A5B7HIF0_PORTR|nr:hypothetical protein [Portunus trituberculatus]